MRNDIFLRARLKLTAFYGASVLLIVVIFSLGIYVYFGADIVGDFEYVGEDGAREQAMEQDFVDVAQRRLKVTLIGVDISATLLAMAIGWMLAGRTLKPIKGAMKQQKQFVSDAAHELRTPLSVMKAGLETIDAGAEPTREDYRELNTELREEIGHVVDLTNDLLFLARSNQFVSAGARREVDLSLVCARQMKLLLPYAEQKSVSLNTDITPGLSIMGDEGQIGRLVLNLLKNSIDYNRQDGEVNLSLTQAGRKVTLEIDDTGIGISSEDIKKVYRRFFKADASRGRSDGGAGLGLSIAREIVRSHGGEITMESRAGEGTKVVVSFILQRSSR